MLKQIRTEKRRSVSGIPFEPPKGNKNELIVKMCSVLVEGSHFWLEEQGVSKNRKVGSHCYTC